jgi:hypothetical protein
MRNLTDVVEVTSADDRLFYDDTDVEMEQFHSIGMTDIPGNWFADPQEE